MILSQQLASSGAAVFLVLFAVAASYMDVKKRIVSNFLNLAGFQTASLLFFAWADVSPETIASYGGFVLAVFLFSVALYQLGAWAGGDAKYFTSLLSFYPLFHPPSLLTVPAVFLLAAAFFLPVLAILHWKKLFSLRKQFFEIAGAALSSSASLAPASAGFAVGIAFFSSAVARLYDSTIYAVLFSVALAIAYSLFGRKIPKLVLALLFVPALALDWQLAVYALVLSFLFAFVVSFLAPAFGVVSSKILTFEVPVSRLEEGMIPAETVFVEGGKAQAWKPGLPGLSRIAELAKSPQALSGGLAEASRRLIDLPRGRVVADALKARGLSAGEIAELKRLKIAGLKIKESVAFAPMISAGFAAALVLLP